MQMGDVVRLRSGGPRMTVEYVGDLYGYGSYVPSVVAVYIYKGQVIRLTVPEASVCGGYAGPMGRTGELVRKTDKE